jgi:hypothetical protein
VRCFFTLSFGGAAVGVLVLGVRKGDRCQSIGAVDQGYDGDSVEIIRRTASVLGRNTAVGSRGLKRAAARWTDRSLAERRIVFCFCFNQFTLTRVWQYQIPFPSPPDGRLGGGS